MTNLNIDTTLFTLRTLTVHKMDVKKYGLDEFITLELRIGDKPVRISVYREFIGVTSEGVGLYRAIYGEVENLPEPEENVLLIVPALVRTCPQLRDRMDLVSPGQLIRDDNNQPIGCDGLDVNF